MTIDCMARMQAASIADEYPERYDGSGSTANVGDVTLMVFTAALKLSCRQPGTGGDVDAAMANCSRRRPQARPSPRSSSHATDPCISPMALFISSLENTRKRTKNRHCTLIRRM